MNQKGFSPVIVLIATLVLAILGGLLYLTYHSSHTVIINDKLTTPSPTQSMKSTTSPTASSSPESSAILPNNTINCDIEGYNGQNIGSEGENTQCIVDVPIDNSQSYQLIYPGNWTRRIGGDGGFNLFFNETSANSISVIFTETQLPLDQSYNAKISFEQGSYPIIDPGENISNKSSGVISNRNVLIVNTYKGSNKYSYYYTEIGDDQNKGYNWLFVFKTLQNENAKSQVESLISTLNRVPGGFSAPLNLKF